MSNEIGTFALWNIIQLLKMKSSGKWTEQEKNNTEQGNPDPKR